MRMDWGLGVLVGLTCGPVEPVTRTCQGSMLKVKMVDKLGDTKG